MAELAARLVVLVLTWGALACGGSPTAPDRDFDPPPPAVSATAGAMVSLTNAERAQHGLAPLRAEPRLMQAAQIHAEQMARLGRLDHVLPGAAYPRPEDRLAAVAYAWRAYAENVAFNQSGPEEVVDAWMRSSGHRANILNASLADIGTGYARDAAGRPYWVQVFGRQ